MHDKAKEIVNDAVTTADDEYFMLGALLTAVSDKMQKSFDHNDPMLGLQEMITTAIDPFVLSQLIMCELNNGAVERIADLTLDRWKLIAQHMGPDYAQGLYHAAVFCTKVA